MKSLDVVGEPIIDLLKKIAIPASTGTLFQTIKHSKIKIN